MKINELAKLKPNSLGLKSEDAIRGAYIEMINNQRTRYHLTLTFKYGVNERAATGLLNTFLKYLNRAILKKRYSKRGEFIKGFAIKESTPSMDNIHFHITLSDEKWMLPDKERMESVIEKKIFHANETVKVDNRISKFLLQNYLRGSVHSNLENYLTKNFENHNVSMEQKINSICPLGCGGVSFGN